jgi:hypothetical protein
MRVSMMIELKTRMTMELVAVRMLCRVESEVELLSSYSPYCAPPPRRRTRKATDPKSILRTMPPPIVIPLFYQQMSSGSGARSTPIGTPLTVSSLMGMQGVHKACRTRWRREGRWMRRSLLDWC